MIVVSQLDGRLKTKKGSLDMFTENDVKVVRAAGPTRLCLAEDRTASSVTVSIKPGEPVKVAGTGTNFVQPLATGDPEVATDEFVGIKHEIVPLVLQKSLAFIG